MKPITKPKPPIVEHRDVHVGDFFEASFLITRGLRCRRVGDSFVFSTDVRPHLDEYRNGAAVEAKSFASTLHRLLNPTATDVLAGGPQI